MNTAPFSRPPSIDCRAWLTTYFAMLKCDSGNDGTPWNCLSARATPPAAVVQASGPHAPG